MRAFVLMTLFIACSLTNGVKVTPVQKVIQLLDDMVAKGESEKQDEQVQFAKLKTFCDSTGTTSNGQSKRPVT